MIMDNLLNFYKIYSFSLSYPSFLLFFFITLSFFYTSSTGCNKFVTTCLTRLLRLLDRKSTQFTLHTLINRDHSTEAATGGVL